jgi:hypothetical protein
VRDAEPRRDPGAVAVVAVEQLQDAGRLAQRGGILDLRTVERVDQPDPPVIEERVKHPLHRLRDDPGQPQLVLFDVDARHTPNLLPLLRLGSIGLARWQGLLLR